MPLSRLDNFLKNVRGNVIYVSPNDLDATDTIDNQGNSMGRPFITIQRALVEAARFSYQAGLDNDRFGKTTILLSPGDHYVDNRPGWIPDGPDNYYLRAGNTTADFTPWDTITNFDISTVDNTLYKLNSIYGGVIIPRGVSIVAQDLGKTKIRPYYVPDPINDDIERSAIFRITGGCYFWQFSLLDADPNGLVYKDYTTAQYSPNFSHHKLTCFEYVDGVNSTDIYDKFLNFYTDRTDLDLYYEKVGLAYGPASGRTIEPDYPASGLDIQPKVDEYRIVGPTGGEVGISSIKAGDGGSNASTTITVTLIDPIPGLNVDTDIQVNDVSDSDYNGSFKVDEVVTSSDLGTLSFKYSSTTVPTDALPTVAGSTVSLDTDTINSSSPCIYNVSMKTLYGMCGLHADGSKITGFKTLLIKEFEGIGLQKDDNAFLKYNKTSGAFDDLTTVDNIHSDSKALYKPSYTNYHIKASNNAIIQTVSSISNGFAKQYLSHSGGEITVNNSISNYGQTALSASGFKKDSFRRDDVGYISHILPPKANNDNDIKLEYGAIDAVKTISVANSTRLYLNGENNQYDPPSSVIQGYRVGAKSDERIGVVINSITQYANVVMHGTDDVGKKTSIVERTSSGNTINGSTLTFTANHGLANGETIRVFSDNTKLPDGLNSNTLYHVIVVSANQIRIAQSVRDAYNSNYININNFGGTITVESRVSDKICGDLGHPIQWDSSQSNWYISVKSGNSIYDTIVSVGSNALNGVTSRTHITRKPDTRSSSDKIYRFLYVIPSGSGITSARSPKNNFVIQESNDVTGDSDAEVSLQYSPTSVSMNNVDEMRNFSFISGVRYNFDITNLVGITSFYTEKPHKLTVGTEVEIDNIMSSTNPVGVANSAYNGTYTVAGISSAKGFYVISDKKEDEGSILGDWNTNTSSRTTKLPTFKRKKIDSTLKIYDIDQVREYVGGSQDGVYYITALDSSNQPSLSPFNSADYSFNQWPTNLYPQFDRDNVNDDPKESISYALSDTMGQVVINDPKDSITKESLSNLTRGLKIGVGIKDIVSNPTGTSHTIHTSYDHGLNRIIGVSIETAGSAYGNATGAVENIYNATLNGSATGVNATARITVSSVGAITNVQIMDGGTLYAVNDVLTVTGTAVTTGFSAGTVKVTKIQNNISDTIRVSNVLTDEFSEYNQLYRISGISSSNMVQVLSTSTIDNKSTTGIGQTVTSKSDQYITGPTLNVTSLSYNNITGIATVVTNQSHGFGANNAVAISGADSSLYNGEFIITNNVNLTTFQMKVGVTTDSIPATSGTIYAHSPGITAQGGNILPYTSSFTGRSCNIYAGITTTISSSINNSTNDEVSVSNIANYDFGIGDYFRIDDEIFRVKTTVSGNPLKVFRGVLGSQAESHVSGSVIKRIDVIPVELRKPSSIRSSGHTFENVGFGPGNYSTALPERQDRDLSLREELVSQSSSTDGGSVVYSGITGNGDYYIGNKKISSINGKEEIFDTPIISITGEDEFSTGKEALEEIKPSIAIVEKSLKVEGGTDKSSLSEFEGPVLFSKKVTSTSDEGIEANSIYLQGDVDISRKYTISSSIPTVSGNPGDTVYNSNPASGGTVGWVYTSENGWYSFGSVSSSLDGNSSTFSKIGVATDSFGTNTLQVGSGSSIVVVDHYGVGIGSTSCGEKLFVDGVIKGQFEGDGSKLTNIDGIWTEDWDNNGSWLWTRIDADYRVGIGTSIGVDCQLKVAGTASTALCVDGTSRFMETGYFDNGLTVTGELKSTNFNLSGGSGNLNVGIITAQTLNVGTGGNTIRSNGSFVGIGTDAPRELLDIEGPVRLKSYYEIPQPLQVTNSSQVEVDLSRGRTFELDASTNVTEFRLSNVPTGSTTVFTIKLNQPSNTYYAVDVNNFNTSSGNDIPIRWPGGVAPSVTNSANSTDIYSFMTFDGGTKLFGGVGGQNYAESGSGAISGGISGLTYNSGTQTTTALGDFVINRTLEVVQESTFKGPITLGDATSDYVEFKGHIKDGTSLIPQSTNVDLGSSSLPFNNGYFTNVNVSGITTVTGTINGDVIGNASSSTVSEKIENQEDQGAISINQYIAAFTSASSTSSGLHVYTSPKFFWNASGSGTLTAPLFSGNLWGNVVGDVNATTVTSNNFNSTSDIKLKTNISKVEKAMDIVSKLDGVKFTWKKDGNDSVGVIAQNVEDVLPELVSTDDEGTKLVNYNGLVGVLIEAVKELNDKLESKS